ncbi:hypothetical protein BABINDRAFT_5669 [Babjeviella inositovora NRRL Y-12698]|uniref:UDENN FLCN/SMCR8-type domain-containing protein n=1 Tax=Babjeviella inositovora NRRL Y-12698 TaxID=984486 RepID=A0A1E3QYP0_9ASCO|nr:uncharacterized protein BABINDRAFT_5669 [Babjeviella inositovora NRRL Y-12698]ODQ82748.1 hypothetical protein BABINDRAFT_5669 [Babjeviella inositovora NRRL Y-12698]
MTTHTFCLAHFCEAHGPSTIMCTQAVAATAVRDSLLLPNANLQTCASCKLMLPDNAANMTTAAGSQSFLSQQYPTHPATFAGLKKVVMKSLSAETTTDSQPLMFGDAETGYSLVRIFRVRDPTARGAERKYALILNARGAAEQALMKLWDIVAESFNQLIEYFHDRALELEKVSADEHDGEIHNERFLRRSAVKPRSLVELMKDEKLFVKLHLWVCETLRDL